MRLISTVIFVSVGIWFTFNCPDKAAIAYEYIKIAIAMALNFLDQLRAS